MSTLKPQVRAIHCDHRADEEQVYAELVRLTAPLDTAWAKLKAAKRIGIKFNQAWAPDQMAYHEGQLVQLVSEKVARAMWLKYVDRKRPRASISRSMSARWRRSGRPGSESRRRSDDDG